MLIFDDSCEGIYQDKNFAKTAVTGRHRGNNCIFVKHDLYHQSKWSRTIDLNTTHIILVNSPRGTQQIEYLGRKLNKAVFLKECYTDSVAEPHGPTKKFSRDKMQNYAKRWK